MAIRINVNELPTSQARQLSHFRGPSTVRVPVWVFATAMILALSSCDPGVKAHYSADPITAWVVDADTGAPVEGVNVVAGWTLKGGLEGGNIVGWMMVMETVTDASGKFSFPGWGPIPHRGPGIIRSGAPILFLFKSGYYFGGSENPIGRGTAPEHMKSSWDGKTITMPKFKGSPAEYAVAIGNLDVWVDQLLGNDQCNWKAIPKFLWAVEQQNRVFIANKFRELSSLNYLSLRYDRKCGSLEAYVEEHGK